MLAFTLREAKLLLSILECRCRFVGLVRTYATDSDSTSAWPFLPAGVDVDVARLDTCGLVDEWFGCLFRESPAASRRRRVV